MTLSGKIPRESMGGDCPQGCVTSHLLWSLAVDKLLWGLNRGNYYTVRYADILKSNLTEKSLKTVSEVLQSILGIIQHCCH